MKDKPKTDQQLVDEFVKAYKEMCKKHQMQIITNPAFQRRDDGTFSVIVQSGVGKLPKVDSK